MSDKPRQLLDYWFGDLNQAESTDNDRHSLWFGGESVFDFEIRQFFKTDLEEASLGHYDAWANTPKDRLALIILLDQCSRFIYRHEPLAFAQDAKALRLCVEGIEQGMDHQLTLIERVFFYMPLEHSEELTMQYNSVMAYQGLTLLSFPEVSTLYQRFLHYAMENMLIIQRFGRFPLRNQILGRVSTPSELRFLRELH